MAENTPSPEQIRTMTRRSFAGLALGAGAALGGWFFLRSAADDGDLPWPLRATHRFNELLGRALFSHRHLAPEFGPEAIAPEPRVNGSIGRPDTPTREVFIEGPDGAIGQWKTTALLTGLPRTEHTTELKCIEGWSQVVHWGGVRFADVAAHYRWPVAECPYVALETASGDYHVGLDTPSLLHPQTLLCDTMNGEPLPEPHGGPLRLVIPVKYGIKNLKWLGRIRFATQRPSDYWAERGYDWYAGL